MDRFEAARVVLALALAVLIAIIGALPPVQRWQQRLGIGVLTSSGFAMLLLGYGFHSFGVISRGTVSGLRPLYEFGLGWAGMIVGMQVNFRKVDRLPPWFMTAVSLLTIPPTLVAALACGLTLLVLGASVGNGLLRVTIVLAACAAVSAPANLRLLLRGSPRRTTEAVEAMTRMDQVTALALLALASSVFRSPYSAGLWRLPRSGWFLVTVGVGFIAGAVIHLLIRNVSDRTEGLTLVVGGIALAAGTAGYLALSVPVVCALAGAVLANVPYRDRPLLERTLIDVERAIYLLLLFIIGTAWRPLEWQGWVLGTVFAISRGYGKLMGARAARRVSPQELPPARTLALALLPESAIAVLVIFTLATVDRDAPPAVRWTVNAVVVGSFLTEAYVQFQQRRESRRMGEETGPLVSRFL